MPTGVAVACDDEECLAVYLGVETGDDEDTRSSSEVSQIARDAARGAGWVISFGFRQPVMTCPACADGRGPLRERGECRRCMGRVDDRAMCVYCLHQVEPSPPEAG